MKHFFKQKNKWLLSTLMIAALGSQYYYSVNSTQIGSVEMSSEATTKLAEKLAADLKNIDIQYPDATTEDLASKKAPIISKYQIELAAQQTTEKKATEAKMATVKVDGCTVCGKDGITLTGPEASIKDLAEKLKAPAVATVPAKVETVVAKSEDPYEKCNKEDTASDKRKCIKEIKDDLKKEKAEAKAEKLKEEKEKRNEEFADKAEALADHCNNDLSCVAEGFTSLLGRYSGSKKVDWFTINQTYNKYIEKDLKAALRSGNTEEALATIEQLTANVPTEYRLLKNKTIDSIKLASLSQAMVVNDDYKMADKMAKANRPELSVQYYDQANRERNQFISSTQQYAQAASAGLNTSNDQTSLDYFKSNFLPDMQKMIASLTNVSGSATPASLLSQTSGSDLNQIGLNGTTTTRNNSRGGSGNFQQNNQQQFNRMNTGVNGNQNILQGVSFGSPGSVPVNSGRRGSY